MREIGREGRDGHGFLRGIIRVGLALDRGVHMLALVLVGEAGNDIGEREVVIGGGVKGNEERIIGMWESGSDGHDQIFIGNENISFLEQKGNVSDTGDVGGHGFGTLITSSVF